MPRLIRICRIQWQCLLFLFKTGNSRSEQIWSIKSEFAVQAEIWYPELFEYAECNGGVHFFCSDLEMPLNFIQNVKIASSS